MHQRPVTVPAVVAVPAVAVAVAVQPVPDVEVHVLNVGQGSCTVVIGPHGRVTVIDGGDERVWPGRTDAADWLRERGVTSIDALVLTHLHRDHSQGLLAVSREFPIGVAHLPYARFAPPVPSDQWLAGFTRNSHVDSPHGQHQLVQEYLDLLTLIEAGGADIHTWDTFSATTLWQDAGWRLERVQPLAEDRSPTATIVEHLAAADDRELTAALDDLSEGTNNDSAVFLLTAEDPATPAVLVSGDQCGSEERWSRIADRVGSATSGGVWILPHHGAPDGPSPEIARRLAPHLLIASAALGAAADVTDYWHRLTEATGRPVIATHDFPVGNSYHEVLGRLAVTIGG